VKTSELQISTKDKLLFWTCGTLFFIYGANKILENTLYKNKFIETKAILVSKICRDKVQHRQYLRSNSQKCYIKYVYSYDYERALLYKSERALERGIKLQINTRNDNPQKYVEYADKIDLDLAILETHTPPRKTFSKLKIGQELDIKYLEDVPWKSTVIELN